MMLDTSTTDISEMSASSEKLSDTSSTAPADSNIDARSQTSSLKKNASLTDGLPSIPYNTHEFVEKGLESPDKENWWDGYQQEPIPNKVHGKRLRNLRHIVFSLYRRLFGAVFVTNMIIFLITAIRGATAMQIGKIVVANLFCAILMRQDYVINAFFNVFTAVPNTCVNSITVIFTFV